MQNSQSSLIVVSNRLPVSIFHQKDRWVIQSSTGGLASALTGVKQKMDFTWIGWPGASFDMNQQKEIQRELWHKKLVPIFMDQNQEKHFYHSFCNSILWPLFHYFTDHMAHACESWSYYEDVNQLFADAVLAHAAQGATVWVHDFHLMLLPSLLRLQRPDLKIGFFLHIPFPSSEIYRLFPKRESLLKGVLGADYLGFHTSDYARHFRLACVRILGADSNQKGVRFQGKETGVGVHPIGMNISSFQEVLSTQNYSDYIQEIQQRYLNVQVVLGVERLDYTKGISLKLEAFERFLEKNPQLIGKVVLLQIIVPSRHSSIEYQRYRSEIEKAISRLNGKYSKPGFIPVQYIYRNLPLNELIALFCLADVCMVASIRDGMNLVAQEFIYCASKMAHAGALLLSEFAGVSHHLPHATLINPLDIDGTAEHLLAALQMPTEEKNDKAKKMAEIIQQLDSPKWAAHFLDKLSQRIQQNSLQKDLLTLSDVEKKALIKTATKSSKRILFLDYDGTLREITSMPMAASPNPSILNLLENLSCQKDTEVHLVSGRDKQTLESWFGHLPISLSAEHGYEYKDGLAMWQTIKEVDLSWKNYVTEIFNKIVEEVPGSFIENKTCSICWHYRQSDLDYGLWRAKELYTSLIHDLANMPVEVITGKKIIEVRAQGVSKGGYVQHVLQKETSSNFVLCIGDDKTDEEMYSALPPSSYSIHVGSFSAHSKYHLKSPSQVRLLLEDFYTQLDLLIEPSLD